MEKFENVPGEQGQGKEQVNVLVSTFSNVANFFLSMAFGENVLLSSVVIEIPLCTLSERVDEF